MLLRLRGCAAVAATMNPTQRSAYTTATPCLRMKHQRRRVPLAGLWAAHIPAAAAAPAPPRPSRPAGADVKEQRVAPPRTPPSLSNANSDADGAAAFALDPPFTPVAGEAPLAPNTACVYACRRCRRALFSSGALVQGSTVGRHRSGWPTFVSPLADSSLELKTVLQRSVVAHSSGASCARTSPVSSRCGSSALQLRVPHTALTQRGLPVEGDLVRLRGRQIGNYGTHSWRETCLRDENHRADPTFVLGYCGGCGMAVCRVTHSAAAGSRFVATASTLVAAETERLP